MNPNAASCALCSIDNLKEMWGIDAELRDGETMRTFLQFAGVVEAKHLVSYTVVCDDCKKLVDSSYELHRLYVKSLIALRTAVHHNQGNKPRTEVLTAGVHGDFDTFYAANISFKRRSSDENLGDLMDSQLLKPKVELVEGELSENLSDERSSFALDDALYSEENAYQKSGSHNQSEQSARDDHLFVKKPPQGRSRVRKGRVDQDNKNVQLKECPQCKEFKLKPLAENAWFCSRCLYSTSGVSPKINPNFESASATCPHCGMEYLDIAAAIKLRKVSDLNFGVFLCRPCKKTFMVDADAFNASKPDMPCERNVKQDLVHPTECRECSRCKKVLTEVDEGSARKLLCLKSVLLEHVQEQ
ncbi:unnamed protein product [Notodromas monacha]|uniref:Uncharacterized protein n=1 Tax=Notodromas monacha TaxID=399045 RepID=A0A7R9BHE8_9CRUS|nr:unnamed protein product [Notodromas monacha]CAG0914147.1 unnamed protein product [Notodromas monacha]